MRVAHLAATPPDSAAVREAQQALFTSGVPGTWVTAAQCSPERAVTEPGVTIYLHGGGFSFSNPPMEQILTHRLSQVTGRPAFAVDYRLAPTHPFPAALEDVVAVHRSLRDQGVPADRILLVGESAGATLVLSALLVLAEAGDATPAGAVAVSPLTDFAAEASPSIEANTGRDVLNPDVLVSIGTQYLAGARPDRAPQSPLYGELRGLPPLLLAVGGDEILLDDAQRFAEAASAANVPVDLDIYDGMPHGFHATVLFPEAERLPTAATFLRRVADWATRLTAAQDRGR
ncbi:MAG: alpha/beta hydrolase [Pseudonocardia sp.]